MVPFAVFQFDVYSNIGLSILPIIRDRSDTGWSLFKGATILKLSLFGIFTQKYKYLSSKSLLKWLFHASYVGNVIIDEHKNSYKQAGAELCQVHVQSPNLDSEHS